MNLNYPKPPCQPSMSRLALFRFGSSMGVLSYFCGLAVALSMYWAGAFPLPDQGTSFTFLSLLSTFFGLVVLSPFIETLVVSVLFKAISKAMDPRWSAYFAGAIFAAAHSIVFWAWGLIVLIPALISSSPFANLSLPHADRFKRSWLTHAVHNTLVFLTIAASLAAAD